MSSKNTNCIIDKSSFHVYVMAATILILFIINYFNGPDLHKDIEVQQSKPVDSMIVFRVKPSDKMLIALWDSDLKSFVFMKYRADSIANAIGTTLIHRDDQ